MINHFKANGLIICHKKCTIQRNGQIIKVEPLVMELLQLLMSQPNQVIDKNTIMNALWRNKYVNDEALTKLVSKLRKALGDDPKSPKFIKTIPKKGYELLCDEALNNKDTSTLSTTVIYKILLLAFFTAFVILLINQYSTKRIETPQSNNIDRLYKRANSHYYQYTRAENESALLLYEKIIASDPDHALSQSGLSNALVQQLIRWPEAIDQTPTYHANLLQSIAEGKLTTPKALQQLYRAEGLAKRATVLAPDNAIAHRSLGLVYAAQQKFNLAKKHYLKAIALDPNEWGAMINLSDIFANENNEAASLDILKQAHIAMTNVYDEQEVIIRPWYHKLAVIIAEKCIQAGQYSEAEIWYRQVLDSDPYNQAATLGLSEILKQYGDSKGAEKLCIELKHKLNPQLNCH